MFFKEVITGMVTIIMAGTLFLPIDARTLLSVVSDASSSNNQELHLPAAPNSPSLSVESRMTEAFLTGNRTRRSSSSFSSARGHCPVVPGSPVVVDNALRYFDFHWDAPDPAEDQNGTLKCPENRFDDWWPGSTDRPNLRAICPWVWKTVNLHQGDREIYPKFKQYAKCVCPFCINARSLGCTPIMKKETFYMKIGCDGDTPILEKGILEFSVGCFCSA